jgi:phospholipase/carboxylesterase
MTRELNFKRRASVSGKTTSVVVFLHGYGADGGDLLGLADPLSQYMKDTVFIAPDAPEKCVNNPMGFQWFPIPWLDGSTQEAADAGADQAHMDIDDFLDKVMEDEGITPDRLIVVGFSQGTMMTLRVIPQRAEPIAGIVGFSGRLLEPETFPAMVISQPPVLLIHGDMDDMVPIEHLGEAADALSLAEFEVYTHIQKGTGHGIAPDGLTVALTFMAQRLGIALPKR